MGTEEPNKQNSGFILHKATSRKSAGDLFASIWWEWEGDRATKLVPDVAKHLVFSFLTTSAGPDVAPLHPDATAVLLLSEDKREFWVSAPWKFAHAL